MQLPFKSLWPYAREVRGLYWIGASCLVASVALKMWIPHLLGSSIDELRRAGQTAATEAPAPDRDHLVGVLGTAALWIAVAAILGGVFRTVSRLCILGNSRRVVHALRRDVFKGLLRLSPSFYVRHQTGHVMSRVVNDMQNVQGLMGPVFMYLTETAVLYAVGMLFMLNASPFLTVVCILPFPLFLWAARRLAGRIQVGTRAAQERLSELTAKVDESLSGQRVIKSLVLEDSDYDKFAGVAGSYRREMLFTARLRALLQPLMVLLVSLSTGLALAIGAPRVIEGTMSLGQLVEMILYLGMVAAPTGVLGFVISSVQRGAAALKRIDELRNLPVTLPDPRRPMQLLR